MKAKNFKKFIYYMFNVDINEEIVKTAIRMWFDEWKYTDFNMLRILDIKVKTKVDHIDVEFLLERPGTLIGRKGVTIKELREYLTDFLDIPVKVIVKEGDIFRHKNTIYYHNLYSRG